jgi:hypothetical protein
MSSIIRIKRSEVSGNPAVLAAGELAYSGLANNGSNGGSILYIGMGTETLGNAASHVKIGGEYYTAQIDAAASANNVSTLVKRDVNGNFSAGTITATLNGNANTATALANARSIAISGDATGTASFNGTADISISTTLATVNANVGSFGSSTAIPVITVDAKGRITGVSTASISTALSIAGTSGTDTVTLGSDTLTFEGGTGVTTTVTNNKVSFAIGQAVSTTSDVTFNSVTVNGTLNSDDITASNISIAGNASITGNLTVLGTVTTVNSTTVAIGDKNIQLSKDATTAAQADGGGITVTGPTTAATITYGSSDDSWNFNKKINASSGIVGALTGNADTATKLATARNLSLTGDATATLSSFDGSGNVSAALTFATVNSNVGSFGSGTAVPVVTVNAKGLVTAVSTTSIPTATTSVLGLASFSSDNFSVSSGVVKVTAIDGGSY